MENVADILLDVVAVEEHQDIRVLMSKPITIRDFFKHGTMIDLTFFIIIIWNRKQWLMSKKRIY